MLEWTLVWSSYGRKLNMFNSDLLIKEKIGGHKYRQHKVFFIQYAKFIY